jgi:DNA-binding response OmpR family regulator
LAGIQRLKRAPYPIGPDTHHDPERWAIIPNVKIVVVEDDPLVRDFVVDTFEFSVNRKIDTFASGFTAWQFIQNTCPVHIVFTDRHVPDMDGLTLIRRIKSTQPEIICILASGNPADENRASLAGADAFVLKPYGINDLFALVQAFVVQDPPGPEAGGAE